MDQKREKFKIVICAHDYPDYVSGPNVWLQRVLPEFRKRNIDCVVLFKISGNVERCQTLQYLQAEGFSCKIYTGPKYTEHRLKWVLQNVHTEKPDIFIPNFDLPSLYASRWIREAGIPTVGVLRSDEDIYLGILDEFVSKQSPYLLSALVCVSRYLERVALENNHNDVLVRRIPSGAPLADTTVKFPEARMQLVYSGRLVEKSKQITQTTHAMCRVLHEVPSTEAIIYGSGSAESSVAKIISEEGSDIPITLGGQIAGDKIQKYLSKGHVFVLLSDYEGLPVSLMEAMANGLVPVCLNIQSGVPELVEHNKTGLLVNDRSDDFVQAIRKLRFDPELWNRLSKGARKKIETEYSYRTTADRWIELLQILKNNSTQNKMNIPVNGISSLPPVHPLLRRIDHRWPGYGLYVLRSIKRKLKNI